MSINNVTKDVIKEFKLTNFIETGIYKGLVIGQVQQFYKELGIEDYKILGVDINEPWVNECRETFIDDPRIKFIHSDSAKWAPTVHDSSASEERTLFFLDTHIFHGIGTNPLYEEMKEIVKLKNKPVIMIDDFANPLNDTHNWIYDPSGHPLGVDTIRRFIFDKTDIVYYPIEGEQDSNQGQGIIFIGETEETIGNRLDNMGIQGSRL